jgi:hypothetical protein
MASPPGKLGQSLNVAGVRLFLRVVLVRQLLRESARTLARVLV